MSWRAYKCTIDWRQVVKSLDRTELTEWQSIAPSEDWIDRLKLTLEDVDRFLEMPDRMQQMPDWAWMDIAISWHWNASNPNASDSGDSSGLEHLDEIYDKLKVLECKRQMLLDIEIGADVEDNEVELWRVVGALQKQLDADNASLNKLTNKDSLGIAGGQK